MRMEDMVLISVDDHITEPAEVFDNQLSGEALATAPKLRERENGANYWEYQGMQMGSISRNSADAVARSGGVTRCCTAVSTGPSHMQDSACGRRKSAKASHRLELLMPSANRGTAMA